MVEAPTSTSAASVDFESSAEDSDAVRTKDSVDLEKLLDEPPATSVELSGNTVSTVVLVLTTITSLEELTVSVSRLTESELEATSVEETEVSLPLPVGMTGETAVSSGDVESEE